MRLAVLALLAGCSYAPASATGDGPIVPDGPPIDAPPGAWLSGWSHRKSITIKAAQVSAPSTGLQGFPVFVALDDAEIAAIAQSDGDDLIFTGADATTPLATEIERYNNGQLAAWVKVPALGNTTDTRLYLYYGNSDADGPEGEDVWTSSFLAVWHLANPPDGNGSIKDATAVEHDGDPSGLVQADRVLDGKVGPALELDGDNDFVRIPSTIDIGDNFTLSAWVRLDANQFNIKTIFSNSNSGFGRNGFRLFVNSDLSSDRRFLFETGNGTANAQATTPANTIVDDEWTHVAVTVSRSGGNARIYVNGVDRSAAMGVVNNFGNNLMPSFIARMGDEFEWPGRIDEVELASERRTPDWILTTFRNQNAPAMFYDVGDQELDPN